MTKQILKSVLSTCCQKQVYIMRIPQSILMCAECNKQVFSTIEKQKRIRIIKNPQPIEKTIYGKILAAVEPLKVGESICKATLINNIWGNKDEFISRSCDTHFCYVKRMLPNRKFKTKKGLITRIS